jgi:predicted small lipoprotein YifL
MKRSKIHNWYPTAFVLSVAALLVTAVIMAGCGKKGPPEPPAGSRPPRVRDLGYGISQNTLKLSWTIPQPDEKAQLPITGFFIYRSQQSVLEKDCSNCPKMFKIIGDVPVRGAGPGQPLITFTETIESGYRYVYKVNGYSGDGIRSQNSNFVEFRF